MTRFVNHGGISFDSPNPQNCSRLVHIDIRAQDYPDIRRQYRILCAQAGLAADSLLGFLVRNLVK